MLVARCAVEAAGGAAADHVVHWTLAAPDGEVIPPFARNTLAASGSGEVEFRLPLDLSGEWTLTGRDVISGESASAAVVIEPMEH